MKKRDYFMRAINAQAYRRSAWVMRCFAKSNLRAVGEPEYDYELMMDGEQVVFKDPESGEVIPIDDVPKKRALFHKREGIHLAPGDMANVKSKIYTTYGNVLWNAIALVDVFGDKLDFITGKVNGIAVERMIGERCVDDPEDGKELDPGTIYVQHLVKHETNVLSMAGFSQLFVPSATERTMTPSPEAQAHLKERLSKLTDDEKNDPVVIAKIWKEVADLDWKWLKEDPDYGFALGGKTVDIVRKRLYYMFGIEANFTGDGTYTFIERPLSEGLDMRYAPIMNNSVRDGSFNRGALTALGGEAFKRILQATAGQVVNVEDCGTKGYEEILIEKANAHRFVGSWHWTNGGQEIFTSEMADASVGKIIKFRTPSFCNNTEGNFCVRCVGEFIRGREAALPMMNSDVGSLIMDINMGAMHGKALRSIKINLDEVMR